MTRAAASLNGVMIARSYPARFGHVVSALAKSRESRRLLIFLAVAYYALVLYVWLNYATHAAFWVPYKFLPFE